nr:MAG TPA: hypothetical protein [Bacteriophage sp.]
MAFCIIFPLALSESGYPAMKPFSVKDGPSHSHSTP